MLRLMDPLSESEQRDLVGIYFRVLTVRSAGVMKKRFGNSAGYARMAKARHKSINKFIERCTPDPRIIAYKSDGDYDGYTDLAYIKAEDNYGVRDWMTQYGWSFEYIEPYASAYDCTGQIFGGKTYVSRVTTGIYRLERHFSRDV